MAYVVGAALVPPALRTATGIPSWRAATVQATRAPRFAVAAARGIVYDIDVHSFRLDGAPRSSCLLPPSRNSAARVRGRSFVARVIGTRGRPVRLSINGDASLLVPAKRAS